MRLKNPLCKIDAYYCNLCHGCLLLVWRFQTLPAWHILMPSGGGIHAIKFKHISGWNYAQRGFTFDRKNRHIATVLAGIKRRHGQPPVQKEAILREDILAMVATLPYDLRGLRDRAILLLGYAGGL